MVQTITCKVKNCVYHSQNNFCLQKLTGIGENGVCQWLNKHPNTYFNQPIEEFSKNTYMENVESTVKEIPESENPHE